jgi:hypothetical protein
MLLTQLELGQLQDILEYEVTNIVGNTTKIYIDTNISYGFISLSARWIQLGKTFGFTRSVSTELLMMDNCFSVVLEYFLKEIKYQVGKNEYELG